MYIMFIIFCQNITVFKKLMAFSRIIADKYLNLISEKDALGNFKNIF